MFVFRENKMHEYNLKHKLLWHQQGSQWGINELPDNSYNAPDPEIMRTAYRGTSCMAYTAMGVPLLPNNNMNSSQPSSHPIKAQGGSNQLGLSAMRLCSSHLYFSWVFLFLSEHLMHLSCVIYHVVHSVRKKRLDQAGNRMRCTI